MSPNVSSFVHDLVTMAQATERLPALESQVHDLNQELSKAQEHNQSLELSIQRYKDEISNLQSKVRSLEVERDDASFRVMEVEDANHAVLAQARSMQVTLEGMIAKLDPPKPVEPPKVEPIPEHRPEPVFIPGRDWVGEAQPQGQSAPVPTPTHDTGQTATEGASPSTPEPSTGTQSEGQSALNPSGFQSTSSETPASPSQSPVAEDTPQAIRNDLDPEPTTRWSTEWYDWNDRRNARERAEREKLQREHEAFQEQRSSQA